MHQEMAQNCGGWGGTGSLQICSPAGVLARSPGPFSCVSTGQAGSGSAPEGQRVKKEGHAGHWKAYAGQ